MPIEPSVNWFSDYDINQPQDGDYLVEGDNHIRNLKKSILAQFPSLGDVAMTATAAELNALDLTAGAGTAEAGKALVLDGSLNIGTINQLTATTVVATTVNGNALQRTSAGDLAISAASGNVTVEGLTFNGTAVTGASSITSTSFVGALTGNASTATAFAASGTFNATGGDVTGSASSANGNYTVNLQIGTDKVGANEIAGGAVGASEIATNAVRDSAMYFANSSAYVTPLFSGTYTLPAGLYMIQGIGHYGNTMQVEVNHATRGWQVAPNGGCIFSDGVNVRLRENAAGSSYAYGYKFA